MKRKPPHDSQSTYSVPQQEPAMLREAAIQFGEPETLRKKNYRLRQSTIDRAMKVLGTRTETETIEQALDLVVFRSELMDGVRGMRGAQLNDVFGSDEA